MSQPDRPNVLLVTADDQRFDTVGGLWDAPVATPTLDRLVEEGCAFTRAHNMGAEHGAVCVPARAMLHSGRSLFHLEGPGGMTTDHPTLPEAFGEAGYRTFGTGKWHNGHEAFNRCYAEGESVFFGGMDNHWNVPVVDRRPVGGYPDGRPHPFRPGGRRPLEPRERTYGRYSSGTHSSELFADTTVGFLEDHAAGDDDDRPFFAYMAFMAPHDPRTAPGEYHALYDPADLELPENFAGEHPFDNGHLRTRDELLAGHPRGEAEVRRHLADYYAMITHLDHHLGRVLDALERTGAREETVVVFTADHGLAVGQHGLMGKQNVYDHSVRVPLVFSGPGVPEGERCEAFSYHHDLYPTLADLAGLETPATVDGGSLLPAMTDGADGPRDSAFTAFGETQRAVRADGRKLIEYAVDGDRHTQLFDVAADPAETTDRSADQPEEVARLRESLAEWRERVDDPALDG